MGSNEELLEAIKNNDLESVKGWVEKGANLHANNDYALRRAADCGHLEIVKCLLEQGADLHAWNDYSLRFAAKNGHLEVVKYLLEQGADSDLVSKKKLIELFTSYNLQVRKLTPRLSSLLLKIKSVKKPYKISVRNKILSTYKEKVASSLVILMYRLYYRPSGLGFFQAIEEN